MPGISPKLLRSLAVNLPDNPSAGGASTGCRTRVFENRYGLKTSIGRGNISFSTINIVRIAIECMAIKNEDERIERFFSKLDPPGR